MASLTITLVEATDNDAYVDSINSTTTFNDSDLKVGFNSLSSNIFRIFILLIFETKESTTLSLYISSLLAVLLMRVCNFINSVPSLTALGENSNFLA